jgi:transposase
MKEFTPGTVEIESVSALNLLNRHIENDNYAAYIGLDVHKKTIAVAIAYRGRGKAISRAEIVNTPKAVRKLVTQLNQEFGGEILLYSYEAGPCGYDLYHQLIGLGQACEIVAPSLIPRKSGDRVKTDKRDAKGLAQYSRAGELTAVWVPEKAQEAMRDLTRAREDIKSIEKVTKQRLGAFLLRNGKIYDSAKVRWTATHFNWLETVTFDSPVQQIVMQEYIAAVKETQKREASLKQEMFKALESWSLRPVVEGLIALRGIDVVSAMTIMAELGDISRFDSPKELMAFLGLVPSEHTSSDKRRLGSITKTGNGHVRRILVESGWSYRFPARLTNHLRRKESKATEPAKAIAWSGQKRLCGRYRKLIDAGKNKNMVCVAIARELVGFVWAIVCEVMGKPHGSKCIA